ncbi:MAG: YihY/virulence factor BrkB family protein [Methyloceanibacter sp.]|nr:YihY/virulence factor BrkB family protein [Methyloceanibacter sp.]
MNRESDETVQNGDATRRAPDSPKPAGRLKHTWTVVKDIGLRTGRDHLSVVSAGCAYYALFAIFPALTASISLYGLTANPANVERQFDVFRSVLPPQAYAIVLDQIKRIVESSGQTLGWGFAAGLLVALWSAHHATQAMFSALNIAYGQPERRGFVHFNLAAFGYTFIGIVGVAAMLFAIISVPVLFEETGHPQMLQVLVTYLRWPLFFLLTLFMLALVYRFGPSHEDPEWHWVTPGSIFATLVWLLASFGFSYYVSNFSNYDRMYGSLGAVIILLFWLYMSFYIVLLGAEINAAIEREHGKRTDASPGFEHAPRSRA